MPKLGWRSAWRPTRVFDSALPAHLERERRRLGGGVQGRAPLSLGCVALAMGLELAQSAGLGEIRAQSGPRPAGGRVGAGARILGDGRLLPRVRKAAH